MISSDARKKMTSENMFIVCDDGLGFETNLERLLNSLKEDTESRPVDLLKKKQLSRRLASIYHEGVKSRKRVKNNDAIKEMVHSELKSYK